MIFAAPTGAHHLKIDPVAERSTPRAKPPRRDIARAHCRADIAGPAQEHYQTIRSIEYGLPRDAPMAVAHGSARARIRVRAGHQTEQVLVACLAGNQGDAPAHRAVCLFVVEIGPDQRLDARISAGRVELDEPKQIGAIRERHRGHVQRRGARGQILDLDESIGDGKLAMDTEMHEVTDRCRFANARLERRHDFVARLVADHLRASLLDRFDHVHVAPAQSDVCCSRAPAQPPALATGANERRCNGVGPKSRKLARWVAVA